MRIAINARACFGSRHGGIGVYVQQLVAALDRVATDDAFIVFLERADRDATLFAPRCVRYLLLEDRPPYRRVLWDQTVLPALLRHYRIDVLHCPKYITPLVVPCPTVMTVHDLHFRRHPALFSPTTRFYWRWMLPLSAARAGAIIVPSEETKDDLVRWRPAEASKVEVIHHGLARRHASVCSGDSASEVNTRWERLATEHALATPFVLGVGTIEPRKNFVRLVVACRRVIETGTDCQLVIAGKPGWGMAELDAAIAEEGMREKVELLGYVDDATLAALYAHAAVVCYPSLREGFGLPVGEALAAGRPVVASDTLPLPAPVSARSILVSPTDTVALADAIERILRGEPAHTETDPDTASVIERYSWQRSARRHLAVYHRAAKGVF